MEDYLKNKHGDKIITNIFGKEIYAWKFILDAYNSGESSLMNKKLKKEMKKFNEPKKTSYLWLTLSPDKLLRNIDNTPETVEALKTWCNNWFDHYIGYGEFSWVVENGSKGDHLHVHVVLEMLNSHKHAEKIKKSWNKHFPNHQLLTSVDQSTKTYKNRKNIPKSKWIAGKHKGQYCHLRFDDPDILKDKLTYLENEKKGSHENLSDLGVRGSRGFLTDNSLETL